MQMHRVLTDGDGMIAPDDPDLEVALEAERDMQILGFVFDEAAAHPTDTRFDSLVHTALKDSLFPQADRGGSKGRDAQFDLFVAAVCQSAGMLPVEREEPDVTCFVDGIKFGIAAKRVKNVERLLERLGDAADQIKRSCPRGIIAIDTCVALNRNNRRITVPVPDVEFGRLHAKAMDQFIDVYHDRIQAMVRGKGVLGLVVHDHQVRWRPGSDWGLESITRFVYTTRGNERRNREATAFWEGYKRGLPNVEPV